MESSGTALSAHALSADLSRAVSTIGTDPSSAEARALDILKGAPGERHALMLVVSARRLVGDLQGACVVLETLARAEPNLAAIQYELGLVLCKMGEQERAIAVLSRATELEPLHPGAWRALGDVLSESGKSDAAGKAYARHYEIQARELEKLERAAESRTDQLPGAVDLLRNFLAVHPTDVSARRLLASIHDRLGQHESAQRELILALELSPGCSGARWALASALVQRANWERALPEIETLLAQDPSDWDCLNLKAHALLNTGEYERAIECFETLVAKCPLAENWMFYGYALVTAGRLQDSIAAYRKAISLKPNLGEAYWSLSNVKKFQFTPAEVGAMRELLSRPGMDARNRWLVHFALGKALEDHKQYAGSFEQYAKANGLFRKEIHHSAEDMAAFVRRSKAVFTPEFLASRAGTGSQAPDPIFIVGLPRSGSTLIEQILASHSSIEGTSELTALNAIVARIAGPERAHPYPEILGSLKAEELRSAGEEYLAATRIHRRLGRTFFIDKMPSNFLHLGLLHLILPNAKIIDARRHPLGCGFAIFRQYFPQRLSFAFDLAEIGRYYRAYVELKAHFDAVLPGRVHRIFYEELVANPERELRRLLDHCGLPFEEQCLRFYETKRGVLTPSSEQVRQPIFTDALEQWRHYEPWLGPMKAALGNVLECYPAVPAVFGERAPVHGTQWGLSASYRLFNAGPPERPDKP